jgi:hypothetical protein
MENIMIAGNLKHIPRDSASMSTKVQLTHLIFASSSVETERIVWESWQKNDRKVPQCRYINRRLFGGKSTAEIQLNGYVLRIDALLDNTDM